MAQDGGGTGWWHQTHNRLGGGARYDTVTGCGWTGGKFVSRVTILGGRVTMSNSRHCFSVNFLLCFCQVQPVVSILTALFYNCFRKFFKYLCLSESWEHNYFLIMSLDEFQEMQDSGRPKR